MDGTADLMAISDALDSTGTAALEPGNYWVSSDIRLGSFQALTAAGPPGQVVVRQVADDCNAVTIGADGGTCMRPLIAGIEFLGPSAGYGSGIAGGGEGNVIVGLTLRDVIASNFGGSGVALSAVITSAIDGVNCSSNGGAGIYLYGTSGSTTPTSCTVRNCYCNSNAAWGFYLADCNYMALSACASDSNASGYEIAGGYGVSLTSCGTENVTGTGFKVNGGTGHSLTSCLSVGNPAVAFWSANGASCSFTSCTEMGPAPGAKASFRHDTGCHGVYVQPSYVTPMSLRGTRQVIG
jgi:hypothetical protein